MTLFITGLYVHLNGMLTKRNLDSGCKCTFICGVRTVLKIEAFTDHLQFFPHGLADLEDREGEGRGRGGRERGGWQERKRRESIEERGTREYMSRSISTHGRTYSTKLSTRQLYLCGSLLPLE